jgi:hypothetical protein
MSALGMLGDTSNTRATKSMRRSTRKEEIVTNRESPDEPEPAQILSLSRPSCKPDAQRRLRPAFHTSGPQTGGLIYPLSLHLGALLPSVAIERTTIGHLRLAPVAAAAVIAQ